MLADINGSAAHGVQLPSQEIDRQVYSVGKQFGLAVPVQTLRTGEHSTID